jgi:hypothetical protein
LVDLIDEMLTELRLDDSEWENHTLPRFLEAMQAWLSSSATSREQTPSWEFIRRMLIAGKIYD